MSSTSGRARSSQPTTRSILAFSELTFQVAIRMSPGYRGWVGGGGRARRRRRALSPSDQAPEHRAVREPVAGRQLRGLALHALADGVAVGHVEAGHLALVPNERVDLPVDRVRDVHDHVWLIR